MLELTDAAAEAIGELTVQPELPETAGLRICASVEGSGTTSWSADLTSGPGPEDEVLEVREGRLYLEPTAARRLEDKVLDAEAVEEGEFVFHVTHRHETDTETDAETDTEADTETDS